MPGSLILQGFQRVRIFEHKKCPFCKLKAHQEKRYKNHKQQYKCRDCQRQFLGGGRLNPDDIWHHYTCHKQTAAELAQKHNVSRRTISRHLKKAHKKSAFPAPKIANLVLDTTYFGRNHSVMVLLDAISKQALFVSEAAYESEVLAAWHMQHKNYLNERSTHPVTGRSHYTHKRSRSACNSLKCNLEALFTYERHPELCIPKTTNLLEERFAELKRRLWCHQGMQRENRIRFIKEYFSEK